MAGAWTERKKIFHGGSFLKLADDNMDIQNPEAQNRDFSGFWEKVIFLPFPHEKTTFQWPKVVSEAIFPTNRGYICIEKWSQIFVSGIGSAHSESEEKTLFKVKKWAPAFCVTSFFHQPTCSTLLRSDGSGAKSDRALLLRVLSGSQWSADLRWWQGGGGGKTKRVNLDKIWF